MLDKSFQKITNNIKNEISKTQLEIMKNANAKLVNLYFNIGKTLEDNSNWGNKFIDNVAIELKIAFPNLKGFSVRNLKYMKSFYNRVVRKLKNTTKDYQKNEKYGNIKLLNMNNEE